MGTAANIRDRLIKIGHNHSWKVKTELKDDNFMEESMTSECLVDCALLQKIDRF